MKQLFAVLMLCLCAASAQAQGTNVAGNPGTNTSGSGGTVYSVATLPKGQVKGTIATVSDGTSSSDCTTGGSTNAAACIYTGTAWAAIGGSSTGLTGSGTTGYLPLFASATSLGNSHCDDGITIAAAVNCSEAISSSEIYGNPSNLLLSSNAAETTLTLSASVPSALLSQSAVLGWGTYGTGNCGLNGNSTGPILNVVVTNNSAYCPMAALTLTSTAATGTAPFIVTSTTPVANLAITQTAHQLSTPLTCAAASGSGTAYTCTTSPSFTPADGDIILFQADVASTGATTLNVNSTSAAPVKKNGGTAAIVANDFAIGQDSLMEFDGTNWQMQAMPGTNCSGGSTCTSPTLVTPALGTPSALVLTNATGLPGFTKPVASTSPVTSSNPTINTDQNLIQLSLGAGFLNTLAQPFDLAGSGVYTSTAASSPALTIKAKLCTISGCASGTVVPLFSIVTAALNTTALVNATWNLSGICVTSTIGSTGNLVCHGAPGLTLDTGAALTSPDTVYADTNTATLANIDLTAALFIQFTVAQSVVGTSNAYTQQMASIR